MLDAETKKRIDTARNILVGKVPDPKSQVEQITIALIYKFMDDMDAEAEELGGKRTFFSGEFARYGWASLMDVSLGGQETLNRYAEGIEKMNQNQNVPQLFRDIFKNAFLPYRDPETLKMFLKTINEFQYDHSERLGDAFEYLLSVMSSQGDAGQFRTPRHIIDFMVELVDPKKEDRVLDPACGTAGFLISAYKHILREEDEKQSEGKGMNPEERKRLMENFEGYDISPDMVRLSLVNLYLHGFPTPKIYEYDTLTSEERWNDFAEVILANPPFMSPKGGIRPHRRFTVESNRSEVLFVDYIMEHLTTNGRAAVIVPEGIIFQSGKAYKALRKMLVENDYLVGVISLPAGVFNPYSGVKTSILWIDRALAKKSDSIIFCKVEHDGYDLGAQRRPNGKDDLPVIRKYLTVYKNEKKQGSGYPGEENPYIGFVSKTDLRSNGEYLLTFDRYNIREMKNKQWPMVELGEILDYEQPTKYIVNSVAYNDDYKIPVLTAGQSFILGYTNETEGVYAGDIPVIIFDDFTTATKLVTFPFKVKSSAMKILYVRKDFADIQFVFQMMQLIKFNSSIHKRYWISEYSKIRIPLPPLNVQKSIIKEIDGYQKIIDGARMVVENYRPRIEVDPSWPVVKLGEVCEINPKKSQVSNLDRKMLVSFVPMSVINENSEDFFPTEEKALEEVYGGYTYFQTGDVVLAKVTPCFENGKAGIAKNLKNEIGFGSSELIVLRPRESVLAKWVYIIVTTNEFRKAGKQQMTGTGGLQRVPTSFVADYSISCPDLKDQEELLKAIEVEQNHVKSLTQLISIYEQKIKNRIAKVWGEG